MTGEPLLLPPAAPTRPTIGAWLVPEGWMDRVLGSDPGLSRLRSALQTVPTIGLILVAERVFVDATHALQIRPATRPMPVGIAAANHQFLVIAMLLGAIVGMFASFAVMDSSARGQLITMLFLPVPMVSALALGLELGAHRVVSLVCLAFVMAFGTYCRRFGPRGFVAGALLFIGDLFGFFLHGAVALADLGWLVAEIGVGLAVAILVRFVGFYPRHAAALRRTHRSYAARARRVAALALELFDDPAHTDRDARRLHRQLIRLNESALMIDAQVGDPSAAFDDTSAQSLHQRLFDFELALTNVARFAQTMTRMQLPPEQRSQIRLALLDIIRRDGEGARIHAVALTDMLRRDRSGADTDHASPVVLYRFAGSVIALAHAMTESLAVGLSPAGRQATFEPSVVLSGGWLPGSAHVSGTASLEATDRRGERFRLAPYTRVAIQMGVAVGAAIALGDVLSGRRFFWAVIAVFITFMGANNSGEQIRKAVFRVLGTLVGVTVGSVLAHVVGVHTYWSITVILVSLFFALYLLRINYTFMVIGITVVVSQLYVQLDEFSNSLLLLRLEETALGAAVAVAVVLLVFPLRTRRVLRIALRDHVQAVSRLADHACSQLLNPTAGDTTLRADARHIDASYQALTTTVQPLRRNLFGSADDDTARVIRLVGASRNYARNLVADIDGADPQPALNRTDLELAGSTLRRSLNVISAAINGSRDVTYTRSASLFEQADQHLGWAPDRVDHGQLAIRDLELLDGTMAQLARVLGLHITDYDTAERSFYARPARDRERCLGSAAGGPGSHRSRR
jgi:uncharacterized membrane protein YgaE (UPF0421/DUF939 family)